MEELFTWVYVKEFTNGHVFHWIVLATFEEMKKLVESESDSPMYKNLSFHKDNDDMVVTHQFDSEGRLWCRTPIKIKMGE